MCCQDSDPQVLTEEELQDLLAQLGPRDSAAPTTYALDVAFTVTGFGAGVTEAQLIAESAKLENSVSTGTLATELASQHRDLYEGIETVAASYSATVAVVADDGTTGAVTTAAPSASPSVLPSASPSALPSASPVAEPAATLDGSIIGSFALKKSPSNAAAVNAAGTDGLNAIRICEAEERSVHSGRLEPV